MGCEDVFEVGSGTNGLVKSGMVPLMPSFSCGSIPLQISFRSSNEMKNVGHQRLETFALGSAGSVLGNASVEKIGGGTGDGDGGSGVVGDHPTGSGPAVRMG